MEEKQLDFSQPILSVRRASSSPVVVKDRKNRKPANVYKADQPEVKLGQVRVSGTVPFMWERSPGTPKNETLAAISEPNSPAVPRLPPGRRRPLLQNASEENAAGGSEVSSSSSSSLSSPAPSCSGEKSTDDEEEEQVSFVDANDTLSRTESSFLNCSVSAVDDGLDTRPNRTLSSDLRAREFMIGRFLPAAEAMASETTSQQHSPRYPAKKQPVLKEQARQIKRQIRPVAKVEDRKDDDDVDDQNEPGDASSVRLCGLLPRVCCPASSVRAGGVQSSSQPSRYGSQRLIDDSFRIRSFRPANNVYGSSANMGWTHNESQPFAPKRQGFLGIPDRYRNSETTVGSILSVQEEDISSFGELLLANNDDPVVEKILYMDPVHDQDKKGVMKTEEDASSNDLKQHEKFRSFGACYLSFSDDEDDDVQKHYNNGNSAAVHPLSLPLPKSPSESWLKKALPTVPSPRAQQLSKSPLGVVVFSKSSPDVWKTIVKASDGKNMRFQFSEGKLKPIPEA
ncbi:hypothetical protein LINGRAHAP2_LOCUS28316 [Linum grandiflorum]